MAKFADGNMYLEMIMHPVFFPSFFLIMVTLLSHDHYHCIKGYILWDHGYCLILLVSECGLSSEACCDGKKKKKNQNLRKKHWMYLAKRFYYLMKIQPFLSGEDPWHNLEWDWWFKGIQGVGSRRFWKDVLSVSETPGKSGFFHILSSLNI